jgi:predicted RND superfamily exporter protein
MPPAFALALTFGTLGIVHPELSIISVAVVALLMGLGVDYSIHLMNRLVEEKTLEDTISKVEKTLKSTGKAVLLSTITTIIGFSSLMISSMGPLVSFGLASAIGILFCFASAIILVPCLVIILKFDRAPQIPSWKKFATFAINNRGRILLVASFFAVISIVLLPYVETEVSINDLSPEGIPEVDAMNLYSVVFGGGANFNALLVETDENGFIDPDVIDAIYNMEKEMREVIAKNFPEMDQTQVEKSVYSIVDEIKIANDFIDRIEESAIRQFLEGLTSEANKLILDRISKEGYQLINEDYSKTIIMISLPVGYSVLKIEAVVNEINLIAEKTTSVGAIPHNGKVSQLTGQDAINVAVNKKLFDEQSRSMIIAILLVLAALIVIFNSAKFGFLTLVPVAFVLLWEPGFLTAFDIPLSVVTISVASIMIGIGIDYGVHITQRVKDGLAEGLSNVEATREAIDKTGLSLIEAALTTIAGVSAIYFVSSPALKQFALIVMLMTALSCIAAALILPVFYCSKSKE